MRLVSDMGLRPNALLDSLLYRFSVVGVPALILSLTLFAAFTWDSEYETQGAKALDIRVLEDPKDALTPAQAMAELASGRPAGHHDTRRSEAPFWFSFAVPPLAGDVPTVVEFPSRHAQTARCWDAGDLRLLGAAERGAPSLGQVERVRAGFALELGVLTSGVTIICRGTFVGPARISATQWSDHELEISSEKFHRNTGLLDGGLLVLAVFVLMTAAINREWTYVLFAAWLVANLRLGAISAGWDTQWLELTVPQAWIFPLRKLTVAANYVLTWVLFSTLLKDELKRVGHEWMLRLTQWSCPVMIVLAIALPYSRFLPVMWAMTALSIVVLAFLLTRILFVTRSMVAVWYSASLAIMLAANLYEVISAALGFQGLIGAVNSVTAALASSLMAAFAIAEQIRQERQERVRAQAELRHAYEAIPVGLFTLDTNGRFAQSNPALRRMLGAERRPLGNWDRYFEPGARAKLDAVVSSDEAHELQLRGAAEGGAEQRWFLVKATLANGRIEGSLQDITETVKATEKLRFYADHDPLTNILNRRGIEKVLDRATESRVGGSPVALAYLDLDRFKLINDLYGHLAGDRVLKQVCDRMVGSLRAGEEIARVGGDEFVIVFPNTGIEAATRTCEEIVESISASPYQIEDRAFQVRVSVGLIEVSDQVPVKDSISMADRACREAKNRHSGNPTVYARGAAAFAERAEELRLIERFGTNVAPEGLLFVMQPILSLLSPHESLDFEVLLRMREPDGSLTPARKVIAAAETNGRVAVIDRWVLENMLRWLAVNERHLRNTRFVCVNMSGGSLNDERFVQDAFAMLANAGRIAERLCIEITESVALHDLANTRRFIDRARSFGARIALDDFGAGYSSFSYLRELPVDAIKIDGGYVKNVHNHPANLAIVEAIVELAMNLGMKSIAEWVEDSVAVETLYRLGVDYVQGYAVGRPQHPDQILLADSAAAFIEDKAVQRFLRDSLRGERTLELWEDASPRVRARTYAS
ncbi:MAG: EAL domain-containing protein [Burkholderiales bacterium]|nr:EAL domain-containing protein [Burkholderiales bacterium]